ncbi:MAG: nucleoside deaminase [Desulfobacteraceae bacterium]|jgi:tRNA(adenine34) deaminase
MIERHEQYMGKALTLAQQALDQDEFPVGCIVVYEGEVIARGERTGTRQQVPSELDHAEMIALRQFENRALTADLPLDPQKAILYSTLEPCLMCFGALLISGIGTIVYGYEDAMGGGTALDRAQLPALYKRSGVRIVPHICRRRSLALFKDFFSRPHINYWRGSVLAEYTLAQSD